MDERAKIAEYCDALLKLLQSSTLDCTNVEPIKAWWACYLGLRALQDARAEWAISNAATLFHHQLAHIHEECRRIAEVHVATDDGSAGFHGVVTELLRERLQAMSPAEREKLVFYNCGPAPMVHAANAVQREFCQWRGAAPTGASLIA